MTGCGGPAGGHSCGGLMASGPTPDGSSAGTCSLRAGEQGRGPGRRGCRAGARTGRGLSTDFQKGSKGDDEEARGAGTPEHLRGTECAWSLRRPHTDNGRTRSGAPGEASGRNWREHAAPLGRRKHGAQNGAAAQTRHAQGPLLAKGQARSERLKRGRAARQNGHAPWSGGSPGRWGRGRQEPSRPTGRGRRAPGPQQAQPAAVHGGTTAAAGVSVHRARGARGAPRHGPAAAP